MHKISIAKVEEITGIAPSELERYITSGEKKIPFDKFLEIIFVFTNQKTHNFRKWIARHLSEYIERGYVMDEDAMLEENEKRLVELEKVMKVMKENVELPLFDGKESDLFTLIEDYAETWNIFSKYDEGSLSRKRIHKAKYILSVGEARGVVEKFVMKLRESGVSHSLFAQELSEKLDIILSGINQTFEGSELYPSIEEKAANILYLIIKDHPFVDGNKRIGSMLFIYFLSMNGFAWKASKEKKLNDNALVALALLVAASDPAEKETMITLIMRLLQNDFVEGD